MKRFSRFRSFLSNISLRRTSRARNDGDRGRSAHLEVNPPQLNKRLPSMKDVETKTKRADKAPLPVDFLLLTVKDCEFLACYMQLVNPFRCWYDNIGFVYFENAGDRDKVKVALIRSNEGSSGAGGALITVKNAVPVLRPKAVISVGACSSLDPEKAKLGDVVVSAKLKELSTGMRSYVSRRFLYAIKHSADGYKAPLNNPKAYEPNVHCDGEFLSGPELVRAESRRKELAESNPQAIAFEREGEGVFTAAFDDQIEWLIVKGIADYADGADSTTESWSPFASVMAASVVAHILSNPSAFRTWPHFEDASYPTYIVKSIRQLNKKSEERLLPVPWCEDLSFHLNDIFTRLKIVGREQTQGTLTDEITNMTAIFKAHEDCETPRTVLIEGDPGMGKTTYCQKLAYDWATEQDEWDESFPETDVLLLLRCRDIKSSSIKEAIDDQILPYDVNKEAKEVFFQFISENQLKVLLVLDGVDEVDASKLEMIQNLLNSKEFANSHIVLTSRHEAGKKVRRYCDTLWEIVGFTERDAQSFIAKYFQNIGKEHLADKLLKQLWPWPWYSLGSDDSSEDSDLSYYSDSSSISDIDHSSDADTDVSSDLRQLTKNPLHTALLCILFEDFNGILPKNRTQLYIEIVLFVLKRYERKNGLSSNSEDLISVYKKELIYLGRMAFQALREGKLDFEEKESGDAIFSLLIKFGFLTIQAGGSKRKPCFRCGFFHKSFQEFFSGLYLAFEINDEEIQYLVTDERYLDNVKEVFLFMTEIAASLCEETAVCFVIRVASLVNLFCHESGKVELYLQFALYCISQCANYQENLKSRLVDTLGGNLNIRHLETEYDIQLTELLFEVVGANSSLTHLGLSDNSISYTGAESISRALTANASLTNLVLSWNSIGDTGAESLSQALTVNSSLTDLNLSGNSIGDTGAESLSQALRVNSSLTNLNLSGNSIGDTGAASLSQALTANSSLNNLDLSGNSIGDTGAASLSQALRVNSSLTNLNLFYSSIGDPGAESLSKALTENSSLTNLDLRGNSIGDPGAESLSQALRVNSSLTNLNLFRNSIGDPGAESLSKALTVNSSLTNLDLSWNSIGHTGAASLSKALTVNSSLTNLSLFGNSIGDTGAKSFSKALTVNSSLTYSRLGHNSIGDTGAESLSQALTVNSSLTNLRLGHNSIGDTGAESLSQALIVNSFLTYLHLGENSIGDTGAESLSNALTVNSSLTNLHLDGYSIIDTCEESFCGSPIVCDFSQTDFEEPWNCNNW